MTYLRYLDSSKIHQAVVTETHRMTPQDAPEVRSISLTIDHPEFSFREGQHVGVTVPGEFELGHEKHFRLYSIANSPSKNDSETVGLELCVRRCFYIDEFSGEEQPGIASNYLCNLEVGDSVSLSGPYGGVFKIPDNPESNLLMIGSGTGIAPFRAFMQHIYARHSDWKGQLLLFYGARSGAETLYRNDQKNDFDQYYDQKTFRAFDGLSKQPLMSKEDGLDHVLSDNAVEIWELIQQHNTHFYLAGMPQTRTNFEKVMLEVTGSDSDWRLLREEMIEENRWSELIYG